MPEIYEGVSMANRDWSVLAARFKKEHATSGISLKQFCSKIGISHSTATRHISVRKIRDELKSEGKTLKPLRTVGKKTKRKKPATPKKQEYYFKHLDSPEKLELYDQAKEASLKDELYMARLRVSATLQACKKVEETLAEADDVEEIATLSSKLVGLNETIDKRLARVESIENTLASIDYRKADKERVIEVTRKTRMENDRVERAQGGDGLTANDMLEQLRNMESDGMLSKGS